MSDLFEASTQLAQGATLSDQVTEVLRHNITNGIWVIGATLPSENALADDLEVSRTVIREAVSRLKAEGMLTSRQGRGAIVSSDRPRNGFAIAKQDVESMRNLSQILELRMGVEIEAAALAAARSTKATQADILAAAEAFGRAITGGSQEFAEGVRTDMQFHRAICVATGNDYYLRLFNYLSASLRETILAGRVRALNREGGSRDAAQEHQSIVNAIAQGDPDLAREMMRTHLEKSSGRLLQQLQPTSGTPK